MVARQHCKHLIIWIMFLEMRLNCIKGDHSKNAVHTGRFQKQDHAGLQVKLAKGKDVISLLECSTFCRQKGGCDGFVFCRSSSPQCFQFTHIDAAAATNLSIFSKCSFYVSNRKHAKSSTTISTPAIATTGTKRTTPDSETTVTQKTSTVPSETTTATSDSTITAAPEITSTVPAESTIATSESTTTVPPETTATTCTNTAGGGCMCPDGATDANCTRYLIDCNDYQGHDGTGRGLVYIKPVDWTGEPFLVVCLGGNTLIQMRDNVSSCYSFSFNRSWSEYREGFGDIQNGCFWLGNDKIAGITKSTLYYLILATEIDENITIVAEYYFMMKSASNNYQLRAVLKHISHLHSDGLDGPGTNMDVNNKYFYTYDNDKNGCAAAGGGGWWYDTGCAYGNLNGNWPRWPIQGTLKTLDVSWLLLQRH